MPNTANYPNRKSWITVPENSDFPIQNIPFGVFLFHQDLNGLNHRVEYVDQWRANPWIFQEVRRVFITLGHASLLMLLYRSKLTPWLMKALSAVGQMAFTNYLMQSIICTFF